MGLSLVRYALGKAHSGISPVPCARTQCFLGCRLFVDIAVVI